VITAGPTREPVDAVRLLTNRSSGSMGRAVARQARIRGHDVRLLLGRGAGSPPEDLRECTIAFDTTAELQSLLETEFPRADLLIMAAAVADFIPVPGPQAKRRRSDGPWDLRLEPAPDLVAAIAATRTPCQRVIGFALEPAEDLESRARAKLARKGLDAIVANPLETMESSRVSGIFITSEGTTMRAPADLPKPAFAAWLLDRIDDSAGP
jgi:phosphopantothenoylcysteine decarboxylase/phosphopantothenate--cysteine ligase